MTPHKRDQKERMIRRNYQGQGGTVEKFVTVFLKGLAFLPVYTTIVVTITLVVAVWGPAFGGK